MSTRCDCAARRYEYIAATKAVLLVGGLGIRLRSVLESTPKSLAPLGKQSFLHLLVKQLRHQGFRHLVMCTGYLADDVERTFGDGRDWDVIIEYSRESSPQGTAGAVKLAQQHLQHVSDFLVMNGDSFLEADLHQLFRYHQAHRGLVTMAVVEVKRAGRFGTVQTDCGGRVNRFLEKTGVDMPGLVNAGVYVFSRSVFEYIPQGSSSLEQSVFPRLLEHGVYALKQDGFFIDIGTPEDYARAQGLCDRLDLVASRGTAL